MPSNKNFLSSIDITKKIHVQHFQGGLLCDQRFSKLLVDEVFGIGHYKAEGNRKFGHDAVLEKFWFWQN